MVIIFHICAFWINVTYYLHILQRESHTLGISYGFNTWSIRPKSTSNRPYSNINTLSHTFLLQTQDIAVILFCSFHSVCVFMCAYYSTWMKTMFLSSCPFSAFIVVPPCKAYILVFPLNCALGHEWKPPSSKATTEWTQQHIPSTWLNILFCVYITCLS